MMPERVGRQRRLRRRLHQHNDRGQMSPHDTEDSFSRGRCVDAAAEGRERPTLGNP
jgi:hypothetical protein